MAEAAAAAAVAMAATAAVLSDRPPRRLAVHAALSVALQALWELVSPPSVQAAMVFTLVSWQLTVAGTLAVCWSLDARLARGGAVPTWVTGKLSASRPQSEPAFWSDMAPRCAANMALAACVMLVAFPALDDGVPGWFSRPAGQGAAAGWPAGWPVPAVGFALRWAEAIVHTMKLYATADFMFYSGHRLMHAVPCLKRHHAAHHATWASEPLTGYYMSTLDFALEHGPIFVACAAWRDVGPAWSVSIAAGAWNLLITHSGWDITWAPDPRDHFFHHNGGKEGLQSNLGIFLDWPCGTLVSKQHDGAFAHVRGSEGRPALQTTKAD